MDGPPWTNSDTTHDPHVARQRLHTGEQKVTQEIPFVGFGLGAMLQAVPSQCSSSVFCEPGPSAAKEDPNAQRSLGISAPRWALPTCAAVIVFDQSLRGLARNIT